MFAAGGRGPNFNLLLWLARVDQLAAYLAPKELVPEVSVGVRLFSPDYCSFHQYSQHNAQEKGTDADADNLHGEPHGTYHMPVSFLGTNYV